MNKVFGIIGAFGKAVLAIAVMVVAVIAADLVMVAFDRDREVYEGLFSTLYALVMIIIFYLIMTKTTLVNNERKIRPRSIRSILSGSLLSRSECSVLRLSI